MPRKTGLRKFAKKSVLLQFRPAGPNYLKMTDFVHPGAPTLRPSLARLFDEVAAFLRPERVRLSAETLARMPRGDGHAVLVLPPAFHGDPITEGVRRVLDRLNYQPYGWELGANIGPSPRLVEGVQRRLDVLADRHGPVSLVGYSLGGLFARWLAHENRNKVRQIITVCSPIRDPLTSCSLALAPLCWRWSGKREKALAAIMAEPVPVPGTYLYSRSDGIVAWANCFDKAGPPSDNIEFKGSHVTIASNPGVIRILAERLAA